MPVRGERKFTTFTWEKEGLRAEIPVWVVDRSKQTRYYKDDDRPVVYFRAKLYQENLPHIDMWDEVLDGLREQVIAELDKWHSIEWDLYLMVETHGQAQGHTSRGYGVNFSYEFYVIGKRVDGETVSMRVPEPWGGIGNSFETWDGKWDGVRWGEVQPSLGKPEVGKVERIAGISMAPTRALVPATIEAVTAVRRFEKLLRHLAKEMEDHFHPDRIDDILAKLLDLPRIPLLPSGGEP